MRRGLRKGREGPQGEGGTGVHDSLTELARTEGEEQRPREPGKGFWERRRKGAEGPRRQASGRFPAAQGHK